MKITFPRFECEYVVLNLETDLVLTHIGLAMVDALEKNCETIQIDVSDSEYKEFLDVLREDYIWKTERLADPGHLISLAQRLLPDFQSLTPIRFR